MALGHGKGVRGRDYAAEYVARTQRAAARGLSVPQARGHAPPGRSINALRRAGQVTSTGGGMPDTTLAKYYRVVARLAHGESLSSGAKAEPTTSQTVKRYNRERELFHPVPRFTHAGKPSGVRGYRVEQRAFTLLARDGTLYPGVPVDAKKASLLARYWNAVDAAQKRDERALRSFEHVVIHDTHGNAYRLLTDVNPINRFFDSLSDEDTTDCCRTFYTGRTVLYAAS